ncbi:MAG: isoleucine--tRNA ligase [archaeon]
MTIKHYDPLDLEPTTLARWKKDGVYAAAKAKNASGKPFYFLDGPPYTSGKVHLGTAWNKSLKDMVLRYKRQRGFDVWDRAGYDMHGLPTENATQKKLGLKGNEEIKAFGVKRFIEECKKLCVDNLKIMNEDFQRLGVWMDFDNAYQSIKKSFIDGEWWLIKRAHEKKRLYEGLRTMHWCPISESALAKHELEYKTITDDSIFVKLAVKGRENEFLIIWTTTPWTIPFNLGVMINPEIEYVKAKVGDESWWIAGPLVNVFISGVVGKQYKVEQTAKGEDIAGLEYIHPFHEELKHHYDRIKEESPKAFTTLLSTEYVDTSSGSGLVHTAPGCGPEDYEVGHRNGIKPFNTLDTKGIFPEGMGPFSGLTAKTDDKKIIELIDQKGALVASTKVEHEYPHDWRNHSPVIFRTTKQWFFKVEDLKDSMVKENEAVSWVPQTAFNAFDSWLKNLRDNSISKQRFWGVPLPVWRNVDNENDYFVVGSSAELEELSGKEVDDLHISTVDDIIIEKDGKTYKRVPDILDVWVDAGTTSWNCLDFPHEKDLFDKLFPADFILEGKDQIRGWFNLLMVASTLAFDQPSFKSVYMHGFINDAMGRKMSKSLGNVISPDEVVEKHGADTLRYYMIGGANPGMDLNYNMDDVVVKKRNLGVLWNLHKYLIEYAGHHGINPSELDQSTLKIGLAEKYMRSKLHSTIKKVTEKYDGYLLNEVPLAIEDLFLSLSRTYIQWSRDTYDKNEDATKAFLSTIYETLHATLIMFAPVAPFITDTIYLNLKESFNLKEKSVHLLDWPKCDKSSLQPQIETQADVAKQLIQSILAGREKSPFGVRWPLPRVVVEVSGDEEKEAVNAFKDIIKAQTNVRDLDVTDTFTDVKKTIQADAGKLGQDFKADAPKLIARLAQESANAVLEHFAKEGKMVLKIDGAEFAVTPEHVIVDIQPPEGFVQSSFRSGQVYLDTRLTKDLEAEGYMRELARRVQQMRKEAGLVKKDRIKLAIGCSDELKALIEPKLGELKDKVGADEVGFGKKEDDKGKAQATSSFPIKSEKLSVWLSTKL